MTIPIRASEATLIEVRQALQRIELNRRTGVKNNLTATTDPGITDDETQGYSAGSHWFNTIGDVLSICDDATKGAAVWVNMFGSGEVAGTGHNWAAINPDSGDTVTADVKGDEIKFIETGGLTITGDDAAKTLTFDTSALGDVSGPASSNDNRIVTMDGTTGKVVQQASSAWNIESGNPSEMTMGGNFDMAGTPRLFKRVSANVFELVDNLVGAGGGNHLALENSGAGVAPLVSAQGETDVSINLVPKGTGNFLVNGKKHISNKYHRTLLATGAPVSF